jgi:hypothetical protein
MPSPTSCPKKKAVIVNGKENNSKPVSENNLNKIINGIGR